MENVKPTMDIFDTIARKVNLDYYSEPLGASYENMSALLTAKSINKDLIFFSALQVIIACLAIFYAYCKSIDKDMKVYSICLMNGFSLFDIKKKIYVSMFLQFFGCFLLSFLLFCFFNKNTISIRMLLASSAVSVVIELFFFLLLFVITNYYTNHIPIYKSFRRSD